MMISTVTARMILDSRGRPTLDARVEIDTGIVATAAVPSGASTGTHEAQELRDHDRTHYDGLGVTQAIANVNGPIAKAVKGMDVRQQREIDAAMVELDGTLNKSNVGANAMLAVSLAVSRAAASLEKRPLYRHLQTVFEFPAIDPKRLPRPMMNVMNGGRHADNGVKIQEYMIVPNGKTVALRIERGVKVYRALAEVLKTRKLRTAVGDEGGYAPSCESETEPLDYIAQAVHAAGLKLGRDIELGLDLAASEFYDRASTRYQFGPTQGGLSSMGMIGWLEETLGKYPIVSIEDPLAEDDWENWTTLTAKIGQRHLIVGDDLFVTNRDRLDRGIAAKAGNAVLIKPNQIGTLSETMDTILRAKEAGFQTIISHRSGETTDAFISDLAVAVGAPFLKAGAPARGERVAKYNRLLAIEQELVQS